MDNLLQETIIKPNWPAPANVCSYATTRLGGVSKNDYDSLNLGLHVGDDEQLVLENRQRLQTTLGYKSIAWLEQVHSAIATKANIDQVLQADASWTDQSELACVVMTADCLPVLFCDMSGQYIAAAHAGWRGLVNGILEETINQLPVEPNQLMAWLGPAIGPNKFEVGAEVKQAFLDKDSEAELAFRANSTHDKYLADIYQLARLRLRKAGVTAVYGGDFCTVSDKDMFFSYRRQAVTGRMASLIWLLPQ